MAYKPYFESYNFQEGLLDAAEYALNAGKKKIDAFRAKGAQKEMGTDAVKLFQKEPKEIIQLALTKYNRDYQKAYNYLKTISQYDLADHEDEMENATDTLKMMRAAIMKVFKFDPEKKSNQKFGGGQSNYGFGYDDEETDVEIKGKPWNYIAKKYLGMFYKNPDKSYNALRDRIREMVKDGEIRKDDRDYKSALEALRAIKNKVDEENAAYDLSKEKKKPAAPQAPEQPAAAAPAPADEGSNHEKAKASIIERLKASPEYAGADKANLLNTRIKKLNALPPEKMNELIQAINANPKKLVALVTGFVQEKPGQ